MELCLQYATCEFCSVCLVLVMSSTEGDHMANREISLECRIPSQDKPEGIVLKSDSTWLSPGQGWLKVRSGRWTQGSTAGVVLNDELKKTKVGLLKGLIFATATNADKGDFLYDLGGDAGRYQVTDVTK